VEEVDPPRQLPRDPQTGSESLARREVACRGVVEAGPSVDDLADESALGAPDANFFDPAAVLDRVPGDLGDGEEQVEPLRLGHLLCNQLARQPLAERLEVAAEGDRSKLRERFGDRRDSTQQLVGILVVVARVPRVAGNHFWMSPPDGLDHRIGESIHVVGAQHPGREMAKGAVEDRLVPHPEIPRSEVVFWSCSAYTSW
jgi:hypothetical protein